MAFVDQIPDGDTGVEEYAVALDEFQHLENRSALFFVGRGLLRFNMFLTSQNLQSMLKNALDRLLAAAHGPLPTMQRRVQ